MPQTQSLLFATKISLKSFGSSFLNWLCVTESPWAVFLQSRVLYLQQLNSFVVWVTKSPHHCCSLSSTIIEEHVDSADLQENYDVPQFARSTGAGLD